MDKENQKLNYAAFAVLKESAMSIIAYVLLVRNVLV